MRDGLSIFAIWFVYNVLFPFAILFINLQPQEKFIIETLNCFTLLKICCFLGGRVKLLKDFMLDLGGGAELGVGRDLLVFLYFACS